jgi:hypothetical protein
MSWTTVNAYRPNAGEKKERDVCRSIYFYECWVPESVAGIGDTVFFYDSVTDLPDRYRDYCGKNGKPLL